MTSQYNPKPSVLAELSEDQQQQLLSWLDLHPIGQVLKMVAEQPPTGFGIITHPNSLRRFYARHQLASHPDENQLAAEISEVGGTEDLHNATNESLKRIAFELATSPKVTVKNFKAIARWTLKLRDQEQKADALALEKERLALERERFELNTARMALKRAGELQEILRKTDFDDEDKIRAARDRLFPRASDDPRNDGTDK